MRFCKILQLCVIISISMLTPCLGSTPVSSEFNGTASTSAGSFTPLSKNATSGTVNPAYAPFLLREGTYSPRLDQSATRSCVQAAYNWAAFCDIQFIIPPRGYISVEAKDKTCPSGFTAILELTLIDSITDQGRAFACPIMNPVPFISEDTPRYLIRFRVSAMGLADGNTLVPSTGVDWRLMCYPNKDAQRLPVLNPNCQQESAYPKSILLWDIGFISTLDSTSSPQTFSTSRRCPVNYTPFISIMSSGVKGDATLGKIDIAGPGGLCISRIDNATNGYTVSLLTKRNSLNMTYDSTKLTINLPTTQQTVLINWELYCYPPIPPSTDSAGRKLTLPLNQVAGSNVGYCATDLLYSPFNNSSQPCQPGYVLLDPWADESQANQCVKKCGPNEALIWSTRQCVSTICPWGQIFDYYSEKCRPR